MRRRNRTDSVQRPRWAPTLCALGILVAMAWSVGGSALASPFDNACKWGDVACMERAAKNLLALGDAEIASIPPEGPGMDDAAAADRAQKETQAIDAAINSWLQARNVGASSGVQASITAQRRIKMYSLTCVIADKTNNALNDPLTSVGIQQQALDALGYYQGPPDGQLTVATRIAIRRFQNAMAWIDSGELTSRQIVYLVCNGAETARDARSATRLALMYAAGVGVVKHHGYALGFLKQAEPRDLDAKYYLAVLSGTGRCGFPQNFDRADERLKEASDQHHAFAQNLQLHHPVQFDQAARWKSIEGDPVYRQSTKILDKDCPLPPLPARALRPPAAPSPASTTISPAAQP